MAYIGAKPVNGFFSKQDITTDGSTTTFALDFTVSSTSSIIVSVGGVIQEPDTAYTLSGGNTSIVFSEAPSATADTYIHYLGQAIQQTITDINGTELVLDVDADTTLTADTDDQIDFKIGGSDVIAFKTTGIHLPDGEKYVAGTGDDLQIYHDGSNSYIANAVGALKVATETSGIAVTIGHSTSEVTFGDNVTVTGNLTIGGTTSFGDFNITNVGSIALDTITNDGTDITLDSSGDIILDAAGNDIFFKAGGTTIGEFTNSSSDLVIKSSVSDKDILIKGNDGGATITALTLDMSAAGAATFNSTVTAVGTSVFTNLDISGDIDVDGTTNLDVVDIDGAVDMASTLQVDGAITSSAGATITTADNSNTLTLISTDADANVGPVLALTRDSSSPADDDIIGRIEFRGDDDGGNITNFLSVDTRIADATNGSEDFKTVFSGVVAGTERHVFTLGSTEAVFNDGSQDIDFRVESNGQANAFKIDAGTDTASFAVPVDIDSGITIDNITIDGTEIDLSSGDLTLDVAGDIILDAGGNNWSFQSGGTEVLNIANSSSDVIIKPVVDAKDIILQQRDGTEVARVEDGAYMSFAAMAVNPEATLTDASTVSWNALTSPVAKVTLAGNRTIAAASGAVAGTFASLLVIQDGTGSRTVTWNAAYEFAADTAPTLTTTASKGDLFVFRYNGSKWLEVGRNLALTLS